jgi:hypothetical protein
MAVALPRDLAQQVARTAAAVVARDAISANGHGNISIRIPNSSEMRYSIVRSPKTGTAGSSGGCCPRNS